MHTGIIRARQLFVLLFFLLSFSVLFVRLAYIQVIRYSFFAKLAVQQHAITIELPPKRGNIYDRNMRTLALSLNTYSVYANPRIIEDKMKVVDSLSTALKLDRNYIANRLSRDKSFIWIKRKVAPEEALALKRLKLTGVDMIKESKRFYPNSSMLCHVLGAVNIDNEGLEGVELLFNRYLKGQSGCLVSSQDARRKVLEYYQNEYIPPKDGFSLVLSIDEVIQHIAERELAKAYEKYHAKGASIIVMNPTNGDVLALANLPNFDLNDISARSKDAVRNRAVTDFYEPGSIFKVVTASAALNDGCIRLEQTFFCENGLYQVGSRTLHDVHPYGTLTFREVIEKSSNIGTIKAAAIVGAPRLYKYMRGYGIYDKTCIDMPGETVGINRPIEKWQPSSMLAIPIGQEVTVTPIQLARIISVIADNGYLVRPRLVRAIIDETGHVVKEFKPVVVRKILSPIVAYRMRKLLMGAVEVGTGKKAKIEDYQTGGKTGTAQKVEGGTYSHGKFVASFIGFAPVDKPALAVIVCVDEPHPVYYGGEVAAPVFKGVVEESLRYLNAKGAI